LDYAATLEKCGEWNVCSWHSRSHAEPFSASLIKQDIKEKLTLVKKQKAEQQNLKDIRENRETPPSDAH
jgi:hypothetical protein